MPSRLLVLENKKVENTVQTIVVWFVQTLPTNVLSFRVCSVFPAFSHLLV